MTAKQKTIQREASIRGYGLHTGNEVNIVLKPAAENTGIVFERVDVPRRLRIEAEFGNIVTSSRLPRCTSIGKQDITIHTVEHLMSALSGAGIDNLLIEIDNNELPGLDGSGLKFYETIKAAGITEQDAEREVVAIQEPIGVSHNGASLFIVPDKSFRVSYTLSYNHPLLRAQFFETSVDERVFARDIAPCRTFCLAEEAKQLQASGLGKGANYKNTLVVGERDVIDNVLHFDNEFARHKVLDFIGDLYLLGRPIRGHAFAVRSGHDLNYQLLKKIYRAYRAKPSFVPNYTYGKYQELNIQDIMRILPHRYPFLLVDRVLELKRGKKAVGIKNVTINDQFFTGHFPSRPVMPGVLMVEAMAQTGGVLVLTNEMHHGKVALFNAADNVKFRKLVEPGEQLHMEVEIIRDRPRTALLRGTSKVNGDVVAEADMLFSFIDASFLR